MNCMIFKSDCPGYVAVQRKLLLIIYTLWEKNEKYDSKKYLQQT